MIAERARNAAIGPGELLYGVPEAQIVNAAFTHPGPYGGRFNSSRRGAWYAGVELKTSLNEVAHHKRRFLKDARIEGKHTFEYADFLADFSGEFHSLDGEELKTCLVPEPIPQCYAPSQLLAETLLNRGSNGIAYPSVRYPTGTCIVCFRPALIFHPRRCSGYRLSIDANIQRFNSEEFTLWIRGVNWDSSLCAANPSTTLKSRSSRMKRICFPAVRTLLQRRTGISNCASSVMRLKSLNGPVRSGLPVCEAFALQSQITSQTNS